MDTEWEWEHVERQQNAFSQAIPRIFLMSSTVNSGVLKIFRPEKSYNFKIIIIFFHCDDTCIDDIMLMSCLALLTVLKVVNVCL